MAATGEKPASARPNKATTSPVRRTDGNRTSRWTVSILVALSVHVVAILILRTPPVEVERKEPKSTMIEWLGPQAATTETLIGEQLALFDNAPLFLPTRWNYAVGQGPTVELLAPTEIFPAYRNKFIFETNQSPTGATKMPGTFESSLEAIREFRWPYLSAFGRIDRPPVDLSTRVARVEVRSVETGEIVFSTRVDPESAPAAADWPDWRPFSLLLDVSQLGTIGEPLVAPPGSQAEDVDAFFRGFVKNELQLDLLLSPGYYSVTVGP